MSYLQVNVRLLEAKSSEKLKFFRAELRSDILLLFSLAMDFYFIRIFYSLLSCFHTVFNHHIKLFPHKIHLKQIPF